MILSSGEPHCFQVDLMMDSIKQDIKLEEDEKQEEQYEKDMKLEVPKKTQIKKISL